MANGVARPPSVSREECTSSSAEIDVSCREPESGACPCAAFMAICYFRSVKQKEHVRAHIAYTAPLPESLSLLSFPVIERPSAPISGVT